VFKCLNSPTTVFGKMFQIALSWTQTFLGTSKGVLTDVHQRLPSVGPSIIMDLHQFLQHLDAQLHYPTPPDHQVLRTNDRFIMDIVLGQSRWNNKQVIQINSCRRYLQALTGADISIITGTRLTHAASTTYDPPSSHVLRMNRFNQPKPSPPAWKTWQKFLRTISTKEGILYQRLGKWKVPHNQTRFRQQFVYDPTSNILYSHYQDDQY